MHYTHLILLTNSFTGQHTKSSKTTDSSGGNVKVTIVLNFNSEKNFLLFLTSIFVFIFLLQ